MQGGSPQQKLCSRPAEGPLGWAPRMGARDLITGPAPYRGGVSSPSVAEAVPGNAR